MSESKSFNERQTKQLIGNLLRTGVTLSAAIVFIGGIFYLIHYGNNLVDYRVFHGEPSELRNIPDIFRFALSFHRRGVIQLGLLVLIATPIARVILALCAFILQRDRMYIVISLIVLSTLMYSLLRS